MLILAKHLFLLLLLQIFQTLILGINRSDFLPGSSLTLSGKSTDSELIISSTFFNSPDKPSLNAKENSFAIADSCPYLEKWFATEGQILDFNYNKVLVVDKTSFTNPRIIDASNGTSLHIPFNYPVHSGFISPQGVVFTGTFPNGDSLYDYNNGNFYTLAFKPRSFKVNGDFCIWTIRDVNQYPNNYHYDSLFLRNLGTANNLLVTNNASETVILLTENDVSNNGVVAYVNANQNLVKYFNSNYTIITSHGIPMSPLGAANPLTDGFNIVYQSIHDRDVRSVVAGQQNAVLTSGYPQYRPEPGRDYQVNNKYIAYINVPFINQFPSQIHVLDPSGNDILVESGRTYDLSLELLNLKGEVMFKHTGQGRKLAKLNGPIIPICYSEGSSVYHDTSWYIVEASQILKIGLNISPDMLDNSSIFTAKDSSYKYKTTDFTDQFNGPGPLNSIVFSRLPVNGTILKNGSPVGLNENIATADLENISYTPGGGFTGNDTIYWNASDGYGFTSNPALQIMQVIKMPDTPELTGLKDSYCINEGLQKIKIANYPESDSMISVDVRLDTVRMEINQSDSSFTFDPTNYLAGTHLMKTTFTNVVGSSIDTQHFYIQPAVIPVVKVTADITNVINLANPVTLTSTNTAGGGTSPLYTFAKDVLFTNILQAQSSNNKLIIDPNTLSIGNNWIFTRMKTSEICFTQETSIDSINITRDAITGITDPDNLGSVIYVNPNPFNNEIHISGLTAAKKYIISLYPVSGQPALTKTIYNGSAINISIPALPSGLYFLTIFDATKGIRLGTVKLIKE